MNITIKYINSRPIEIYTFIIKYGTYCIRLKSTKNNYCVDRSSPTANEKTGKIMRFFHASSFPKRFHARRKRQRDSVYIVYFRCASSPLFFFLIIYNINIYIGGDENSNLRVYRRFRARIYSSADWSIHHSVYVLIIILMSFFAWRSLYVMCRQPRRYTEKICSLT